MCNRPETPGPVLTEHYLSTLLHACAKSYVTVRFSGRSFEIFLVSSALALAKQRLLQYRKLALGRPHNRCKTNHQRLLLAARSRYSTSLSRSPCLFSSDCRSYERHVPRVTKGGDVAAAAKRHASSKHVTRTRHDSPQVSITTAGQQRGKNPSGASFLDPTENSVLDSGGGCGDDTKPCVGPTTDGRGLSTTISASASPSPHHKGKKSITNPQLQTIHHATILLSTRSATRWPAR